MGQPGEKLQSMFEALGEKASVARGSLVMLGETLTCGKAEQHLLQKRFRHSVPFVLRTAQKTVVFPWFSSMSEPGLALPCVRVVSVHYAFVGIGVLDVVGGGVPVTV